MTGEQSAASAAFTRLRAAMAVEGLTTPEKAVLLVLAIMANAEGQAWPSIAQLGARASTGRRTAFRALDTLEERRLIQRETTEGKGTRYTFQLDPCHSGTGATTAPVSEGHPTGATAAPKQPMNNHRRKKATPSPSTRLPAVAPYPMPDGVDPLHWRDFLANRKRKRLANTASAHETLIADLTRHATADWPWPRLIALAAGKGWASVRNPDREDTRYGRSQPAEPSLRGPRPDPALDLLRAAEAALAAEAERENGEDHRGAWPALPSYGGARP